MEQLAQIVEYPRRWIPTPARSRGRVIGNHVRLDKQLSPQERLGIAKGEIPPFRWVEVLSQGDLDRLKKALRGKIGVQTIRDRWHVIYLP
jgi:hypothetical protein